MTEVYVIQSGDTLTKIAKEKYGLSGNAAYQKALEIAKENGIQNPNLIYTGNSLNLNGLGEEEPKAEGDNFQQQNAEQAPVENAYNNLLCAQKQYAQALAGLNEENKEVPQSFQIAKLTEENTEQDYIDAILELTEQHIEENDKEDENGVKDGAIDYEEFAAQQIAFYRSTYGDLDTSDDELEQLMGLQSIFNMYDIDESGVLETNEVAFSYIASDINFDDTTFGQKAGINIEGHAELDGIIDFEQMNTAAMLFNDDMLQGGKTYSNIYNKISHLFTDNKGGETKANNEQAYYKPHADAVLA